VSLENRRGLFGITAVLVVVATTLILVALFLPVRRTLYRQIDQRYELEAQLIYNTITNYLDHSIELASQIPSRSQIRREMARYSRGEITREAYREFARPRLQEAVDAAADIIAVTRVDRNRTPLVVVGMELSLPESRWFHPSAGAIAGTVTRADTPGTFVVVAPVRDPDEGLIGYDLVGISLGALQEQLSRATRLFDDTTATLSDGDTIVAASGPRRSQSGSGTSRGDVLATVRYQVAAQWDLTIDRPRETLYSSAESFLQRLAIATGVIAVAILLVIHRSVVAMNQRARTAELERDLANRRLLMQEVHHRIKNDLSMVGSLLSLQRRSSTEPATQTALSEAEQRLEVVSEIYDQLYQTEDVGRVRIREVLREFMTQFHDVAITLSIDDLLLDRKVAIPVGIIINELVVNAVKYGKPSTGTPEITIQLARPQAGMLTISVRDNGPGFPSHDPSTLSGFGLSMVETLSSQYSGELTIPETDSGGAIEVVLHHVESTPT
jgi:two-component sensor histidine kinase